MSNDKTIMRIQKNKYNPYVIMNKEFLSNENLSFKAKGILSYLLSKPDDWIVLVKDIVNRSKDGRDSVYSGIKELIEEGYIVRHRIKEKGKFIGIEYFVYEYPVSKDFQPNTEKPDTEKPNTEKPEILTNKRRLLKKEVTKAPNNKTNFNKFIPQHNNFDEREYDDNYFEQFYANKTKGENK
jgi:hypothetical protein